MNSNKKNEEIKLRVTKQEKEQIRKLSSSSKNMTAYILKKVFAPDSDNHKSITETVETLDLVTWILGVNMTRLVPSLREPHIFLPAY